MVRPQELDLSVLHAAAEAPPLLPLVEAARPNRPALADLLQNFVDEARRALAAHHAVIRLCLDGNWSRVLSAVSLSEKYAAWKILDLPATSIALDALVCPLAAPMRLTQDEVRAHPGWKRLAASNAQRPPLRGWLAVPLINRLGRNIGMIELTDKEEGDFDAEDQRHLTQLGRIASLAIENAGLFQSAQDAKREPPLSVAALQAEVGAALTQEAALPEALQAAAELFAQRSGVALARIWVSFDGVMKLQASAGLLMNQDDARTRVPVGQFSIGHIARTRLPLVANSIVDHPHIHDKEWSRREGLTAFAGCPLLVDNELVGVIAVFDSKPILAPIFDALTSVARDLALAVKHKRVEAQADNWMTPTIGSLDGGLRAEHAVFITGRDGIIADWNRGAERFFGFARADAIGRPAAMLVPAERLDEHQDILRRILHGEQVPPVDTVRQQKSGRCIDVRLTLCPLRDASGSIVGAITVGHDLAEFKLLQQQYCTAQKMEVFGQLAGGVAHDFNNLLTVILGYCEIAMTRVSGADSVRDLLGEIHKAGERAGTLTRQLLAFSRKKVLEPKVLDLNAVVSDTEKMLRRLIGEDILMTTMFAAKLKPVKVDPGQMQQVILNLAVNARDAMPRGGRLTIETANVTLDDAYAQAHPGVLPGPYVLFAMNDTGVGMNDTVKARIFEPLFTTKGPGKGTGLGLTTVNTIVKQYGGHIEVHSEVNRGSTFMVYFPQVQEAVTQGGSHAQLRTIPRGSETILLVEDEDSVRNFAHHVLELNGYRVLEAINGEEAIALTKIHAGPISLLVTDVVMPQLGGKPLADHLLALRPQLKVLFLSGYTNDAIARHGVLDSEFAFLQKPFSTAALAQKVRDILDQPAHSA